MNRWIHSEQGFIGSFDLPWFEWSRIADPDPDHPKGTHSQTERWSRSRLVSHTARKRLHQLEEMSWTLHKEGNVEPPYPPELILQAISEAQYKRTQHFWPKLSTNVGCYRLCPFAHPVACCCVLLRVVACCCATFRTCQKADLATERERQVSTARANQAPGLTNRREANWAPENAFSPFRELSRRRLTFPFCC